MRRFRKMREDPDLFSMDHLWQNIGLRLMSVDLQSTDLLHLNRRSSARDLEKKDLDSWRTKCQRMVSLDIEGFSEQMQLQYCIMNGSNVCTATMLLWKKDRYIIYPYCWQCLFLSMWHLQFPTKSQICKCLWVSEVWERRWCCGTKARPMWGMVQGDRVACGYMKHSLEEILFSWGNWATPTIIYI